MSNQEGLKSYDRVMGSLIGAPDTVHSKPTTIRIKTALVGNVETFIVQTFRQREQGDTVFIEHTGPDGYERYYLPPAAVAVLVRHRDQLEKKNRRRAGQEQAAARKAAGIDPGFLRGKAEGRK